MIYFAEAKKAKQLMRPSFSLLSNMSPFSCLGRVNLTQKNLKPIELNYVPVRTLYIDKIATWLNAT